MSFLYDTRLATPICFCEESTYEMPISSDVLQIIRRREKIRGVANIDGGLHLQSVHSSSDGTRKLLFMLTVCR